MKHSRMISILSILAVCSCLITNPPNVGAQKNTGLTAMTLASIENVNNSSIPSSSSTDSINLPLQNETVNYYNNASGYLVYPAISQNESIKKLPAVVMIHENKGLNDYIIESANLVARNGYVVLAVDLFNGEVTTNPDRSSALTAAIRENPETAISNLKGAVRYLGSLDNVEATKIASLGWCFGGQQSLQLALNSKENPLAATVIYYGRPSNDTQAISNISWPVLGIFGGKDQAISVDSVKQFQKALNDTGITNEIYVYPNVGHAFANPSNDNYAPQETADAWKKTLEFLNKYLKSPL